MSEEGKTSNDLPLFSADDLGFSDVPELDDDDTSKEGSGENMTIVGASELDPDLDKEEEEEEKDDEGDDNTKREDSDDLDYGEDADDQAIGLYKTLLEKGTIIEDEENPFDGTWDSLDEHLSKIPYYERSKIYSNAPEPLQKLLEFAFADERNITRESIKEFINAYLEDTEEKIPQQFDSIDSAREYLKKEILAQGVMDEAEVDIALDALEEKEDDGAALIAKANAIEKKKAEQKSDKHEQLLAQKRAEAKEAEEAQNKFAQEVSTVFDQTGWSKSRIDTVKRQLINRDTQKTFTTAWNSPKALVQLANLATFYDEKTGEFDLTKFVKQVASKSIKDLKNKQIKDNFTSKGSNAKSGSKIESQSSAIDKLEAIIP